MFSRLITLLFVVTLISTGALFAAEKGWFGFSVAIGAETIFSLNPVIRAIKIADVEPDSPASRAGLQKADEVLELENVKVAGKRANELKPLMQKSVGETLHLRLKHSDGREYSAALVAAAKR